MTERRNITILPETEIFLKWVGNANGKLSSGIENLVDAVIRLKWYSDNVKDPEVLAVLLERWINEVGANNWYKDDDKEEMIEEVSEAEKAKMFRDASVYIPGEGLSDDSEE